MTPDADEVITDLTDPVLSAAAMRDADAYTSGDYGVPTFTLMETAGRAAVAAAVSRYGSFQDRHVVILCGKGNNGGDGLVMARIFLTQGASVTVAAPGPSDGTSEEAGRNRRLLESLKPFLRPGRLSLVTHHDLSNGAPPSPDLYVDALLGTGLTQKLREPILGMVSWLNRQRAPVLAVDVPTGLHSDTGEILGDAVRADLTVTMGALKPGLVLGDGPDRAGMVVVAEIGIPRHALIERADRKGCALRSTDALVRALLPRRGTTAHKYSVGLAVVVGGSPGLTGAPVMASIAAARIGAGAVVCACHQAVQHVLASKMTEIMTLGLPGADAGEIAVDAALEVLAPRLRQARALLVGCGMGRAPGTAEFIRQLCARTTLPLVIDADGLNALSGHLDGIAGRANGRWVLTPHSGEFARLSENASVDDRIEAVRTWADRWNSVLVLKGLPTLVGTPGGRVYVSGAGNPALATAGTGDVLAGMIAGLLAQGLEPEHAAICGVHLGGASADAYVERRSGRSMQATDLLRELPMLLAERFENGQ